MDDDIIDVNCGRCGSPLRVPLDDLRDVRIVECGACSSPRGKGGKRAAVTGLSAKRSGRAKAMRVNQRQSSGGDSDDMLASDRNDEGALIQLHNKLHNG